MADIAALSAMYASSVICLSLSSLYHVQMSGPADSIKLYFALDLTGIVIAIVGSYIAGVHASWPCDYFWKVLYLTPPVSSAAIQLFMLMYDHQSFLSEAWDHARILLFSIPTAMGILPAIHWVVAVASPDERGLFIGKLFGMFALYGAGLVVFVARIPERWAPGTFDHLGSSH